MSIEMLTNARAAEFLGVQPGTLKKWRSQGVGPIYYKVGRAIRYKRSDLLQYLKARQMAQRS